MRFILYRRCSTDEQSESKNGLNAQSDHCASFAATNGGEIVGTHSDEGISGGASLEKRPALLTAISELKRGDVLLVAKRDRLGRDPMVVAMIEAAVNRKGARVLSAAGEGTSDDDPTSVLMRRMVDAFSEYERLIIKARTKAALHAKKIRNERVGHIPFGFRLAADGRHLESEPNEQEILTLIRELRGNGLSLRAIASQLTTSGLPNRGKDWNGVSVLRVSRGKGKPE